MTLTLIDPLNDADIQFILDCMTDPTLFPQGPIGARTMPQIRQSLAATTVPANWLPWHKTPTGPSLYLIRPGSDNPTGDRIGLINVTCRGHRAEDFPPDMGWAIIPAYQRRGYASEAAARVKEYFLEEFQGGFRHAEPKLPLLCTLNDGNEVSEKVARGLGMEEVGEVAVFHVPGLRRKVFAVPGLNCPRFEYDKLKINAFGVGDAGMQVLKTLGWKGEDQQEANGDTG